MPDQVRAVIVGAGLMGRWHAHAIRKAEGRVVAVVDVDRSKAVALAQRIPMAKAFPSIEAALGAGAADVVHICTPSGSHAAFVRAALGGRCHVLAEKPLAETAEETADLLATAAAAGRLLVPVHQFGLQRGILQILASRSELGHITHLEFACASAGAAGRSPECADEVAAEILPHALGLTRQILAITLEQQRWSVLKPRPGEWRVTGHCGDTSVEYLVSMATRPTFAELRVFGERASARADLFHGFAVIDKSPVSRTSKAARPFRMAIGSLFAASANLAQRAIQQESAYPGLTELVRRVHFAAMGQGRSPILPSDTLDIAETRDQLIALARPV
jgi:predicted dehydrogenase